MQYDINEYKPFDWQQSLKKVARKDKSPKFDGAKDTPSPPKIFHLKGRAPKPDTKPVS